QRLLSLLLLGLQTDLERAFDGHRHEVAVNAVNQTALLADFLGQTRNETATTQDIVTDIERKIVRITTTDTGITQQNMRLAGWMLNALFKRLLRQSDRTQRWRRGGFGQGSSQAFGNLGSLFAAHVADQGNDSIVGAVIGLVELQQIGAL